MTDQPTVLFVCHHNANRSQIAAAYLERLAGDRLRVVSAGPAPAEAVNPAAVDAMAEEGFDLSSEVPAQLTDATVGDADVVITLGCADAVPLQEGKRYEEWTLAAPAAAGVDGAREVRDEIKRRVEALAGELLG